VKSDIEMHAINYRDGTSERNCQRCVYIKIKLATGLQCCYYDLPTSIGKWCSLGLLPLKQEGCVPIAQGELF